MCCQYMTDAFLSLINIPVVSVIMGKASNKQLAPLKLVQLLITYAICWVFGHCQHLDYLATANGSLPYNMTTAVVLTYSMRTVVLLPKYDFFRDPVNC